MRTVQGISAPRGANLICQRCAGKIRRAGVVALIGLAIINLFTLIVLHVAKHHF
jgi:hypothetical protein